MCTLLSISNTRSTQTYLPRLFSATCSYNYFNLLLFLYQRLKIHSYTIFLMSLDILTCWFFQMKLGIILLARFWSIWGSEQATGEQVPAPFSQASSAAFLCEMRQRKSMNGFSHPTLISYNFWKFGFRSFFSVKQNCSKIGSSETYTRPVRMDWMVMISAGLSER